MDYLPFGEQIAGGSATSHKFTGKERDIESGLDNFGARYNSSVLGRWMSPDVINLTDARVQNPANTLNKYILWREQSAKILDLDGRDITGAIGETQVTAMSRMLLSSLSPTSMERVNTSETPRVVCSS